MSLIAEYRIHKHKQLDTKIHKQSTVRKKEWGKKQEQSKNT